MASCIILKNLLTCLGCQHNYDSQLLRLDCYHFECEKCLHRYCEVKEWSTFKCPTCDYECTVPEGGIQSYPVEKLQSKLEISNRLLDNDPECYDCCEINEEEAQANKYCTICQTHLCLDHANIHHAEHHFVVDIRIVQTEKFIAEELKAEILQNCSNHSHRENPQQLVFYCNYCRCLICRDCRRLNHSEHKEKIVALKKAGENRKMEISKKRDEIESAIVTTTENIQCLESHLEEIQETNVKTVEDIKQWQEDMVQMIHNFASESIKKVETNSKLLSEETSEFLESEKKKMAQLENTKEFTQAIQNFCSDTEIIEDYKTFEEDLNSCLQRQVKIQISANHLSVEHKDLKGRVDCLKECFGEVQEGKHRIEIQSLRKKVELVGWKVMSTWKAESNNGVAVMGNDVITVGGNKIELHGLNGEKKDRIPCQQLKNAWNVSCSLDKIYVSDKEKKVVLILDVTGRVVRVITLPLSQDKPLERLGLGIDISNGHIFTASYNSSVVYKSTEAGQSATSYITEGLSRPHYICISSKHEVIASNLDSDSVCKFSRAGDSILWEYGRDGPKEEQLKGPYGVCVDDLDNVFIADYYNDRIHYVSSKGRFIRILDTPNPIKKPMALTFAKNTLIITNVDNIVHVIKCHYE